MLWKIWYDDESVVTDEDMKWEDAPSRGVLIILHYQTDTKKQVHMGADYYLMRSNTIISFHIKDLHDHISLGIPKGAVKFGRWCPDDVWKRVYNQVFKK